MKILFNIAVFVSMFMLFACSEDSTTTTTQNDPDYDKIKYIVDSIRANVETQAGRTIPTLSILINTSNKSIFATSTAQGQTSMTQNTFFRFASNSKNFTSTAILNMMEDGWLNLSDKITDNIPGSSEPYVPNMPAWNIPNKSQITIRQLLQHSAGVYDVDNDTVPNCNGMSYTDYKKATDPTFQFTADGLVEQVTINNLVYFAPGTGYHYSNTGFTILSEIIARVYSHRSGTQKNFKDYMYDNITGPTAPVPLNVGWPFLASDVSMTSPFITAVQVFPNGNVTVMGDANMSAHVAEGNGFSTPSELNKYVRSVMKGQNVLTSATVQTMQTDVSSANPHYGLGCINVVNMGFGHNGAINGNLSFMLYDPLTDVSIIMLMTYIDYSQIALLFNGLLDLGYESREALGFPGRP